MLFENYIQETGVHFKSDKTFALVDYWPCMKIINVIGICERRSACQLAKGNKKNTELYRLLPISHAQWEDISRDVVSDLPKKARKVDSIFVVAVNPLSKIAHFIPFTNTDAYKIAQLLFTKIVSFHGLPKTIVSDRDTKLIRCFWKTLWMTAKTKVNFSIVYQPQTDGQTEVVKWSHGELLWCLVRDHIKTWDQVLPMVELAYNNSTRSFRKRNKQKHSFIIINHLLREVFTMVYNENLTLNRISTI